MCRFLPRRFHFDAINIFWLIYKGFPWRLLLCDIHFKDIPISTTFCHPLGIVIKTGTKMGECCIIHQNVTIGDRHEGDLPATLGHTVNIGAGAIILGPVKIGNGVTIGAGAIVLTDVPDYTTVISKNVMITRWIHGKSPRQ